MNICTIIALRDAVSEKDLETLVDLLDDKDRVVAMTSGNVINMLGEVGQVKLKSIREQTLISKNSKKQYQVEDYLQSQPLSPERIELAKKQECR